MGGVIITIVSVGVGMAVLLVGLFAWLRSDMVKSEERLRGEIAGLSGEINDLRDRIDAQIGELRERMAHLEGLLEGLREAITGRVAS